MPPGRNAVRALLDIPAEPPPSSDWRQRTWLQLISGFDGVLRWWHEVYEFSPDPECVLRLAFGRSTRVIRLANGIVIAPGEPIGILHFWNEHLPPFPPEGPNLHWAKIAQRRMECSLQALGEHVRAEPGWRAVRAFRAEISLSPGASTRSLRLLAKRYGFEIMGHEMSGLERCHTFGEDLLQWGYARAFNPAALRRRDLFRDRCELWMSREALIGRRPHPAVRAWQPCAAMARKPMAG